MRIVGLDPSLASTGVALADGTVVRIRTTTDLEVLARIDRIELEISDLLGDPEHRPELVVIEGLGGAGRGREAALKIVGLGAVLRLSIWRAQIPIFEVAPSTLKAYATGSGRADKAEMRAAYVDRLRPTVADRPLDVGHDEIDALWLRDVGLWLTYPRHSLVHAGPAESTKAQIVRDLRARASAVLRAGSTTART